MCHLFQKSLRLKSNFDHYIIRATMSISPPPLKRRRLSPSPPLAFPQPTTTTSNHVYPPSSPSIFRILSYNVNSIAHLLPPETSKAQKPITSFFHNSSNQKPSLPSNKEAVAKKNGSNISDQHDTAARRSAPPAYLRQRLKQWHFPDVVCLQEVKISATDVATQDRVKDAANRSCQSFNASFRDSGPALDSGRHGHWEEKDGDDNEDQGPEYEAFFCLPTDTVNARGMRGSGKVHGICTLVRKRPDICIKSEDGSGSGEEVIGSAASPLQASSSSSSSSNSAENWTVRPVDWDHEGRCLILTIPFPTPTAPSSMTSSTLPRQHPRPSKKGLKILNLYMPNGTDLPYYHSPPSTSPPTTRHVYKRHFHAHLARLVRDLESESWMVVMAGDMNISRTEMDSYPQLRPGHEHVTNRRDFERKFLLKAVGASRRKGGGNMTESIDGKKIISGNGNRKRSNMEKEEEEEEE